ncbi:MAG: flagellar hook-associated protein FlgK [Clostridiales bacterium]|nr:flagellar hook-associated protein FlgK [Clostridiales bacterium]
MASTFGLFESAKSGLSVAMQQLNVTEQNIANVNTEGYTRQRMLTSAKEPPISLYLIAQLNKTAVGQGVEAIGIQQIRSEYLDQQYRSLNSGANHMEKRSESLTYLTGLFNELKDKGTLKTAVNNFFTALNTFSQDTSSKEFRTNVQQQALSMTQSFNNVYEEMRSLWHEQNSSISIVVQKVNSIAQKIAELNDAIASAVQTGGTANDLNDERNLLLDQLSGYVNITYNWNEDNDNMIDVAIGGLTLVEGKTANEIEIDSPSAHAMQIDNLTEQIAELNLATQEDSSTEAANKAAIADLVTQLRDYINVDEPDYDSFSVVNITFGGVPLVTGPSYFPAAGAVEADMDAWIAFNRNHLTLNGLELSIENGTVKSGQLFSNMEMITNGDALNPGVPYYMDQLNMFVREMAENINTIHQSGWTYPDVAGSQNGINFFKVPDNDYSRVTAGNFTLSDEVLESVYNIAGSSEEVVLDSYPTNTGNNDIALQLSKDLINSGYYDKLNSIVVNLAIAANTSESIMDTKQSLLASVDTQRKSLSAVSLDEETTNLIIFQQSYNAAARIISVLDDMLNTMINNMGITGR